MTKPAGFGLYVHWPFCQAKCPYCDFNSHVASRIDQRAWQAALISEIRRYGTETPGRVLNTIFFGGGTPSLMEPESVAAIIDAARGTWAPANDMEITLEANPTSVEAGRFLGYRDAGVNRVSMGIQALRDPDLKALGRLHTVAEARAAFDLARNTFPRVSFDLIYARQSQSLSDWKVELKEALAMAADHLSLYQLTIEPGTAFGDRHALGRLRGLPDEDISADMYEVTQALTDAAGLPGYEISNHAAPGAESRHNLIYWRGGDWVGVGPGAHGRLTVDGKRIATEATSAPSAWLQGVENGGGAESVREIITDTDSLEERLMMGLRLREGVPIDLAQQATGRDFNIKYSDLENNGFVERSGEMLRATAKGRPVLNAILREFLA